MKVEQLKKWYEQGKWSKARLVMVVKAVNICPKFSTTECGRALMVPLLSKAGNQYMLDKSNEYGG